MGRGEGLQTPITLFFHEHSSGFNPLVDHWVSFGNTAVWTPKGSGTIKDLGELEFMKTGS